MDAYNSLTAKVVGYTIRALKMRFSTEISAGGNGDSSAEKAGRTFGHFK